MFSIKESILVNYVRADKLYRKWCMEALSAYGDFTANEVMVLMFLSNPDNAPMDTATEIAYYRNISKGNIAKSVESLTQQGYLIQKRDESDRRNIHLQLSPQSGPVVESLTQCRKRFIGEIEEGFSEEDRKAFQRVSRIFEQNLSRMMGQEDERQRAEPGEEHK